MKLRNKKTGEIIEKMYPDSFVINSGEQVRLYNSLAELNEEWEDYDETETYFINAVGGVDINALADKRAKENFYKQLKVIENYFETKEEAEKAVEKHGKSGVVSWTIPFGVLDILCNRKEGVVGSMIRENKTELLFGGEE